jgi:hypothetical protein
MAARPDAASARSPVADGLWTLLQVDQQRITALDTLDLQYRRIQLLHAERSDQIEQQVAPEYRLRSGFPRQSRLLVGRGFGRYATMAMFYAALLALLTLALIVA